jgi:hypothetical protein
LLSDEHFTVDGTLIEAWAGKKSFKKKGEKPSNPPGDLGNPAVDFKGEKRSNVTHQSTTDPDARLYKKAKGQESKLCYMGSLLMENRNGLAVKARITKASGKAELDLDSRRPLFEIYGKAKDVHIIINYDPNSGCPGFPLTRYGND